MINDRPPEYWTAPEELAMFRDMVRKFLDAALVPNIDDWRRSGVIDRDFYRAAGRQGLLCATVPEQFGGAGCDFRFSAIILEEFTKSGIAPASFAVHSDVAANYLLRWARDDQKARYLPAMVSGDIVAAIAMTEPGAGSDLQAIRTTAVRTDGGYVINGQKTFITSGQNCDLLILAAKTDPGAGAKGISLFLVDATTPGFRKGRKLEKMGGTNRIPRNCSSTTC